MHEGMPSKAHAYMMLSDVKCHDAMSSCLQLLVIVIYVSFSNVRFQYALCAQFIMLVQWRFLGIDKHHRVDQDESEEGTFSRQTP